MKRVIGLALTLVMTFIFMVYALVTVGFVTGNLVAAGIVSLFVGSAAFVTVWVLINKRNGLKF